MRRPLLLLFVVSWAHVGALAPTCGTRVIIADHVINMRGSEQAGANVTVQHMYQSGTLDVCTEDCCKAKFGICTVIGFKNQNDGLNCIHILCQPLSKCRFLSSKGTDTYTFPSAMLSKHPDLENLHEEKTNLKSSNDNTSQSFDVSKEYSHAVSARKGVNSPHPLVVSKLNDDTHSKPRKGVGSPQPDVTAPFDDDTHSKGRKGALPTEVIENLNDDTHSKARKGVSTPRSDTVSSLNDNNHSKPRKGVGSLQPDVITTFNDGTQSKARKGVRYETDITSSLNDDVPSKSRKRVGSPQLDVTTTLDDGTQSKPRKGVTLAVEAQEFVLKNDNTTIKPRKGVGPEMIQTTSADESSTTSNIKPKKGATFSDTYKDGTLLFSGRSKVKPRKGVEPFVTTLKIISTTQKPSFSSENFEISYRSSSDDTIHNDTIASGATSSGLLTSLEQIFLDDFNETKNHSDTETESANTHSKNFQQNVSEETSTIAITSINSQFTSLPDANDKLAISSLVSEILSTSSPTEHSSLVSEIISTSSTPTEHSSPVSEILSTSSPTEHSSLVSEILSTSSPTEHSSLVSEILSTSSTPTEHSSPVSEILSTSSPTEHSSLVSEILSTSSTPTEHSSPVSEILSTSSIPTEHSSIASEILSTSSIPTEHSSIASEILSTSSPTKHSSLVSEILSTSSPTKHSSLVSEILSTSSTPTQHSSLITTPPAPHTGSKEPDQKYTTTTVVKVPSPQSSFFITSSNTTDIPTLSRQTYQSSKEANPLWESSTSASSGYITKNLSYHDQQEESNASSVAIATNDTFIRLSNAFEEDSPSEKERKYTSSMHLVLSLVFGLLVLLAVLGAVAKRIYDVWMRRHYHRMDFLIDGMYDGYS